MRNLKKFLALVLAFMMTMSLMVTVNASNVENHPDAEDVTVFQEAIDVLLGMGIIRGGDNNAINPKSNVSRAEMAAFIYRLYSGDVDRDQEQLYAQTGTGFTDVDMSQWYAGVIGFCASYNFIAGRGDGTFDPTGNVTGYEALVMVLRAMGYDKDGEFTGNGEWRQNAHTRALTVGLLNGVNSATYNYSLVEPASREFIAEIVFRAANLPMVTYNRGFINKYEYMNAATGVANQTLGQWQFGLTSNTGIIVGNQATGESVTKIGFDVDIQGNDPDLDGTFELLNGATITNRIPTTNANNASPYHYATTTGVNLDNLVKTNANVTLSFRDNTVTDSITKETVVEKTAQTDLRLFNHKVTVWYDNRSNVSERITAADFTAQSVSFPTNVTTYTIRDEAVAVAVVVDDTTAANTATISTYVAAGSADNLGEKLANNGYAITTAGTNAYYNYAFSPMASGNHGNVASTADSAVSPINANDSTTDYGLYLVISNTGTEKAPGVDVIITLDMTVTQIIEDNKYQKTESFGVLNSNGNEVADGTTNRYFGASLAAADDQVAISSTDTRTYLNIPRAHLLNTDASKLGKGDYVSVVAIAGTAGGVGDSSNARGTLAAIAAADTTTLGNHDNGNAPRITAGSKYNLSDNEFYYQINTVTEKVAGVVKYISPDWDVTIEMSDGTTKVLPMSIFALATDGNFAGDATRGVTDVQKNENYYFYLDQDGEYLFYEKDPNANTKFVYGTYMDWQTSWLSAQFDYGLVFIDGSGTRDSSKVYTIDNRLATPAVTDIQGILGDTLQYAKVQLPKREDATGSAYVTSATVAGVYVGYVLDGDGNLKAITATEDYDTGFFQATDNNFGHGANKGTDAGNHSIKITSSDVKVGAKEIGADGNKLALTKDTEFYLVTGTGSGDAKAKKVFMSDLEGCEIRAYNDGFINTDGATHRYLLDGVADPTGLSDTANSNELWKMVYYSIDTSNTYAQLIEGGAKPVAKVFLPEACVKGAAASATGTQLIFVGDADKSVVKKNSSTDGKNEATMFNVFEASTGAKKQVWIKGYFDGSSNNSVTVADNANDNTFYKLLPTSEKAHDGETIYELTDLGDAEKNRIVGKYWDVTAADRLSSKNDSSGEYLTGQFFPAYFGNESYGYIRDVANNESGDHLVNIAGATIVNLNETRYPVMSTPHDLLYAASIDTNKAVNNVSYYTSAVSVVAVVYINA